MQNNISLKPYNTFGIDVNANRFSKFSSIDELKSVLAQRKEEEPLFFEKYTQQQLNIGDEPVNLEVVDQTNS